MNANYASASSAVVIVASPEYAARDILARHWDRKIPVLPAKIATALHVRLQPEMLGEISGRYFYDKRTETPCISWNISDSELRQRFTIAHELGHFVLEHGENFRDPAHNFSLDNYQIPEVEANRFAAELLMPRDALDYYVHEKNMDDIALLAKTFMVSEQAMLYRLRNLGWLT